ncbi:MAG: DNA-deoxyinosine glycosylase [Oscillospiraceae bacterium]|nr:DNA-deoxyinosine glycosylase [Oscillospiraceae bacterium]
MDYIIHSIKPVYNHNSKVLILGTLPSPKSREAGFFYSHPQNRFWKIMEIIFGKPIDETINARIAFLLEHNIAMWDVISECCIEGASDATIKKVVVNDFSHIFLTAHIKAVFLTGKTAYNLYEKYCAKYHATPYYLLPSPSSANCAADVNKLVAEYKRILEFI